MLKSKGKHVKIMREFTLKILQLDYHRNGVGGNGFYIIAFDFEEDEGNQRKMVGIVFEDQGNCAVFDRELLGKGEVRFFHNSWRGDHFEKQLREAIRKDSEDKGFSTNF